MAKKKIQDFKIIDVISLNRDHFLLKLQSEEQLQELLPGQFAQVKIEQSSSTFLRRPFSIHDVNYANQIITLFIKIAGKGTQKLSESRPGEIINMVYPLGNSFTIPDSGKVLLTGGGCGVAPLLFLAKTLAKKKNVEVHTLIGSQSADGLSEIKSYNSYGTLYTITEDGSVGEKGLITGHSLFNRLNIFDMIYACGPEPMLKAIAAYAKSNHVPCEVSLENLMACGIGACLCCVTETTEGNQCVCTEGPVFNINKLKW